MNPKLESPNFTQTPNMLLDYWQPIIGPGALSVLMVLVRITFGWHKTSDKISLSQLVSKTGMSKSTVIRSVEELLKVGLVNKLMSSSGYGQLPNEYSLNIEKPNLDETPKSEKGGGSVKSIPGVVSNLDRGVVSNLYTQKKASLKENTKENIPPLTPPSAPEYKGHKSVGVFPSFKSRDPLQIAWYMISEGADREVVDKVIEEFGKNPPGSIRAPLNWMRTVYDNFMASSSTDKVFEGRRAQAIYLMDLQPENYHYSRKTDALCYTSGANEMKHPIKGTTFGWKDLRKTENTNHKRRQHVRQ